MVNNPSIDNRVILVQSDLISRKFDFCQTPAKRQKTTSIMKLEIHFVIELVGLAILSYYENSIVICKIDDCLMFRFFSVDVGNQFSWRTPPSILSRQYLAKLGLTLPVERY